METSILNVNELENVLQSHWAEFLDSTQLLRVVRQHINATEFKKVKQDEIPSKRHIKLTVSSFKKQKDTHRFDVAIEFTVPKDSGIVIGTALVLFDFSGLFEIYESYGTHFVT